MPAVITHFQGKVLRTQFLKTYSELQQAAMLVQVKQEIDLFEYARLNNSQAALDVLMSEISGAEPLIGSSSLANFEKYFYIPKLLNKKSNSGYYCDATNVYRTNNGHFYSMDDRPDSSSLADPKICVDINGQKAPNALGHDLFVFIVQKDGRIVPFTYVWTVTQTTETLEDLSKQCKYGSSAMSCSYFALSDTSPEDSSKSYWKDFLGYK